jgi:hypothetical protein
MKEWSIPRWTSGQYYKPITIVNDDSRVINKFKTSLTDDARVVIYDRQMFIVQATDYRTLRKGWLLALLGLRWMWLMVKNTLAYYETELATDVKGFKAQAPGPNVINI